MQALRKQLGHVVELARVPELLHFWGSPLQPDVHVRGAVVVHVEPNVFGPPPLEQLLVLVLVRCLSAPV